MREKKVFTVCFFIALFIYSGLSIYKTFPTLKWDLTHMEISDEEGSG